jgi:flagellar basal body-associated protein FliL
MGEASAVRESQLIAKIALIVGIVAFFLAGYATFMARGNASDLEALSRAEAGGKIMAPKAPE